MGVVRDTPALAALARRLIRETYEVGRASGIALPDGAPEAVWNYIATQMPDEARASTLNAAWP